MKQQENTGGNRSIAEVFTASLGAASPGSVEAVSLAGMDPSWSTGEVAGVLRRVGKTSRSHRFAANTAATEVELAGPESLVSMLLPWEADRVPAKKPAGKAADGPADGPSDEASDPVAGISDLLQAVDRLASWAAARQAELIADLHREVQSLAASRASSRQGIGTGLGFTLTVEELAPLLNISGRAAHRLLGHSLTLALDLPKTLQSLGAGVISIRQAQIIADEALFLPAEVLAGFEDQVLQRGAHLTPPRLKSLCHRIREKLHPDSITTRKAAAVEDRHVELTPAHDGMAWFSAYLPAEQACGIEHRLTFMARALQHPQEDRTLTQLKADLLGDLLTHHCEPGAAATSPTNLAHPVEHDGSTTGDGGTGDCGTGDGSAGNGGAGGVDLAAVLGVHPVVFVTVPVMTLLGGDAPADLAGYGPIDPDTARKLAAHAPGFTRILTHPETGTVLSVGRQRYTVPESLRRTILVRDKTCRHPGCNRPAPACDLDHTIPWHQGGTTSYDNLAALCRKHHKLKTDGYWHYHQPDPGTLTATSLTGKTYTTTPDPPPF
ncbi:HNH endonuclease signature motif containing protein [Arthrobacter sp. Sr33]